MHLSKHHGLGNDFLVARIDRLPQEFDPALAIDLCDRRRGIGADGLIWWAPASGPRDVSGGASDAEMVLFNSDGSIAEISGNGVRCLGQAIWRTSGTRVGKLSVATGSGIRTLSSMPTDHPLVDDISVDMGAVLAGPEIPALVERFGEGRVMSASVGNPHIVVEVTPEASGANMPFGDVRMSALAELGPLVEAAVPGGVNVHMVTALGDDRIAVAHWERGAGLTDACGSGASVSAWAAVAWGLTGHAVTVEMPGGTAEVEVGETIILRSPITFVADIEVPA